MISNIAIWILRGIIIASSIAIIILILDCFGGRRWEVIKYWLLSKLWYQWFRRGGKLTNWILKKHIVLLILLFFGFHGLMAAVFGYMFVTIDGVYRISKENGEEIRNTNFEDCFYYSVFNQTTLGGGQLIPKSHGRAILSIQSILSLLLNAMIFGLIVLRIINRQPHINFPKELAFDSKYFKSLTVQIWNRDSDSFYDIKIGISITRRVDTIRGHKTNQTYSILMEHDTPDLFRPGMVVYGWAIRADHPSFNKSSYPQKIHKLSEQKVGRNIRSLFLLEDLKKGDDIELVFEATSVSKGHHVVASKSYTCKQIECGAYPRIRPFENENDIGPKKFRNFYLIDKEHKNCNGCNLKMNCIIFRLRGAY